MLFSSLLNLWSDQQDQRNIHHELQKKRWKNSSDQLNSLLHLVPKSLHTFEQILNSFISAFIKLKDDFIEVTSTSHTVFLTTSIQGA